MDFIRTLGDTVKKARKRLGLTQLKAAEICSIDSRTILNIENYRGNPKMTVLFPLVRGLQIDSQEIFYPGMEIKNPSVSQLRFLIEDCSEQEADSCCPILPGSGQIERCCRDQIGCRTKKEPASSRQ